MRIISAVTIALLSATAAVAGAAEQVSPRIAWHGTLQDGLAEAERSGRPILLVSGAPQCLGVSGTW